MKLTNAKYYIIPLIACALAAVGITYYYLWTDFSTSQETQYLYVDDDDTVDSVSAKLQPMASAHAMTGLRTLIRHSDYADHLLTGRYAIEPGMSTYDVVKRLRRGEQSPIMLTIPEAKTTERLAALLARKLMADSLSLIQAMTDEATLGDMSLNEATLPCLFIPDTYEVYWNIGPQKLMERMKREYDHFWNAQRRQQAAAQGLSPCEVATLASIVDEETANNAEKPRVAGLYLNRLRKGMLLQADPTVKFAVGDFSLRRILNAHLRVESPYNTYRNMGLPPGPIKVASIQGIEAVLNAEAHNYIYMCAKEDFSGTHNFATNLQEHLQNARRYQRALNERGIK